MVVYQEDVTYKRNIDCNTTELVCNIVSGIGQYPFIDLLPLVVWLYIYYTAYML